LKHVIVAFAVTMLAVASVTRADNVTITAVKHVSFQFAASEAAATPEPATFVLLGVAFVGGLLGRRWVASAQS
jgi:hypothetical protein